ncbi:MAG: hypothetical protein WA192_04785 [Candidatus Acidiferrales bacterium]
MTTASRSGGYGVFGITVLLCLPAAFAVFSSEATSRGGVGTSGVWFMYQVSQYLSVLGIVVAAAVTAFKASEGKISRIALSLMGLCVGAAIFLLWYAVHIFRSPWF